MIIKNKVNRLIYIGFIVALLIVTYFLVKFKGESKVNNWILAYLTVLLAFATIYYAFQSYQLYAEAQKKRYVDFWEKRLSNFYLPFIETLNKISECLSQRNITELYNLNNELVNLIWGKGYMVPHNTIKKIKKMFPYILMAGNISYQNRTLREYRTKEEIVRNLIISEWDEIECGIRKLYGSYGVEEMKSKNPKKQKKGKS